VPYDEMAASGVRMVIRGGGCKTRGGAGIALQGVVAADGDDEVGGVGSDAAVGAEQRRLLRQCAERYRHVVHWLWHFVRRCSYQ